MARSFKYVAWFTPLIASALVAAVGWWAYRTVDNSMRTSLQEELQTILNSDVEALRQWADSRRATLMVAATDPRIEQLVVQLIVLGDAGASRAALAGAPAQAELRGLLAPSMREHGFPGWAIFTRAGRTIAAGADYQVGETQLADRPRLREVLSGSAIVTPPHMARPVREDPTSTSQDEVPIMFMAAPVRDPRAREVVALMAITLDLEEFTEILSVARIGVTGDTYAFTADGVIASHSRFESDLREIGLLPADTTVRSLLTTQIRNPGANMLQGFRPIEARLAQPLTRMAADAIAGNSDVDVDGYLDYRGVPVVGAWTWLPEMGIGVATEVEVAEAYETLAQIQKGFLMLFGLLVVGAAGMFAYSMFVMRLQRTIRTVQRLGRYRLQKKIGEGGIGKVYLAKHAMLRRPTAIKLIRSDDANQEQVSRFEREVQFTSQLTHPNTIAIYDYGRTPEGVFYYAMEYLEGITLDQLVDEAGPLPGGRVIHILTQVCGSLAEAHEAGLIHRDIKPANIIVGDRGGLCDFVKVLDFGLVRKIDRSEDVAVTQDDSITGSPLYLSPEHIMEPDTMDGRSDIYAVGAVAYFLLTGEPVFRGNTAAVFGQHLSKAPPPLSEGLGSEVAEDLEAVILQCLAKDRNDRPASAEALADALRTCDSADDWSASDARAWWAGRAPAAGAPNDASTLTPVTHSEPSTFAVDLKGRTPTS